MIVSRLKPIEEIVSALDPYRKVFLIGCGECATVAHAGGEPEIMEMKRNLEGRGKIVTGWVIPRETCHIPLVKKELRIHKDEIRETEAILVMACGAGVQAVAEATDLPIFTGVDTLFLGTIHRYGRFTEYCSMCGRCVLNETAGICPVTRCPKGLINGPCGGVLENGHCEVNPEMKCVWVEIYEKLKDRNQLQLFSKLREPRNFDAAEKPGKLYLKGH